MKRNQKRAKLAITMIWIVMGVQVAMLLVYLFQINLLNAVADGADYSESELLFRERIEGALSIVNMFVYIISIVTFIQWFRRAYFNLHTKADNLLASEGWAAGAWFVPFLNLFWPYQIMQELYNRSNKLLTAGIEGYRKRPLGLLGWWWFLWVLTNIGSNISFRMGEGANDLDALLRLYYTNAFISFLEIPLCILIVKIIRDYSEMENMLYQLDDGDSQFIAPDGFNDDDILDIPVQ